MVYIVGWTIDLLLTIIGPTVYYFVADISDESLKEVFDMRVRMYTRPIFIQETAFSLEAHE